MVEQKGNALALEQASSPNAKEGGVGYYRVQMLYLQVRMSEYPGGTPLGVPSEYLHVRKLSLGRARRGMQRGHRLRIALHGLCLYNRVPVVIRPVVFGAAGWLSRPLALSRAPLCRGGL